MTDEDEGPYLYLSPSERLAAQRALNRLVSQQLDRIREFRASDEGQAYMADVYSGMGVLRTSEDGSIERVPASDFKTQIEE